MFGISADKFPFLQTRRALLVLDLQNDFVEPDGVMPVTKPPDFVQNILNIAPLFRDSGKVLWIRTQFEASRPINTASAESENVVTNEHLPPEHWDDGQDTRPATAPQPSRRFNDRSATSTGKSVTTEEKIIPESEEDQSPHFEDAYLTIKPGRQPICVLPASTGANVCPQVVRAVDSQRDLFFQKTYYSAFRSSNLLQTLRGFLVTELFICGALTNSSVYATALDAARHGYSITIIQDALGYRSQARHDEALRQLVEATGCEVLPVRRILRDLQGTKRAGRPTPGNFNDRSSQINSPSNIQDLMTNLSIKDQSSSPAARPAVESVSRKPFSNKVTPAPDLDAALEADDGSSDDAQNAELLAAMRKKIMRSASTRHGQSSPSSSRSSTRPKKERPQTSKHRSGDPPTVSAPPKSICEGDTSLLHDLLPAELAATIFDEIRDEVLWQRMSHRGGEVPRLVAIQGEIQEDGSIPIYRHPSDESPPLYPFSEAVLKVRAITEQALGHSLNHVLIQLYRDGTDYISEHSDKTLDIGLDTYIANVSLGAQRTMVFRSKAKPRQEQTDNGKRKSSDRLTRDSVRIELPHNSLCKLGLSTNARWLHSIRQDKRQAEEKSDSELAYGGIRISLTFRSIATFLSPDQQKIWGQGATSKSKKSAQAVINGSTPESEALLRAFAKENQSLDFDWKAVYGSGFDVLHMSNARKLSLSGDAVTDLRVKIALAEQGLDWTAAQLSPPFKWSDYESRTEAVGPAGPFVVTLVDNDSARSTAEGDMAILLYLASLRSPEKSAAAGSGDMARIYTRMQLAKELHLSLGDPSRTPALQRQLARWDAWAKDAPYIAGMELSVADYAFWPVLHNVVEQKGLKGLGFENLERYHHKLLERFRKPGVLDKDD